MKSTHQLRVESFMRLADQPVPYRITEPYTENKALRAMLILEEALETVDALGFNIMLKYQPEPVEFKDIELYGKSPGFDLLKVVDGCCDLKVVTTGTLSSIGVPDLLVQQIVDEANLRKFGPGSFKDKNGKWIKPPDYVGPEEELRKVLRL